MRCVRCGEVLDDSARFCGVCGTPLVDPNLGRTIGARYVLRERVGAGSLGTVYRAEQIGLGRKLAIKLLTADAARDRRTLERFRREGEVLCKLRSPHTVTTYEFDREPDGALFIAMELSPGRSLADVIRTERRLAWPRVMRILLGLCDSLAEAHGLGIVHRDLKPENILLETRPSNSDFVKVLDFGLAKVLSASQSLSPAGQSVGAVEYASPEQLMQRPIDGRSDLYGLGVLGFLLLTGFHPFPDARSFGDLVAAQIQCHAPPASSIRGEIPADVDSIISRCLEKDPERRYPDATAVAGLIQMILSGLPPDTGDTIREPERLTGEEPTVLADMPPKR